MLKSGKMQLSRAINLEKKFNIGEIYLKLEGQNPTAQKNDRIAEVLVWTAIANNNNQIIAYGSQTLIKSIMHSSELCKLKIITVIFISVKWC